MRSVVQKNNEGNGEERYISAKKVQKKKIKDVVKFRNVRQALKNGRKKGKN